MISNIRFPNGKKKALLLSFDDGKFPDLKFSELLNKYGIKGTFNINSSAVHTDEETKYEDRDKVHSTLKLSELKKIHSMGHEIAIHGLTHASLWEITPTEAVNEVIEDRKNLERKLGTIVRGMAYANGDYNDEVISVVKNCGVCYSRTTKQTESITKTFPPKNWLAMPTTCKYSHPKLMEFAKEFTEREPYNYEGCFVFYVWGHSWELEKYNHWTMMENFFKLVGNRNDVWYATGIELYDYVKAFKSINKSAAGDLINNPSGIKLWFDVSGKTFSINPGETLNLSDQTL